MISNQVGLQEIGCKSASEHKIEEVGKRLRDMMPWIAEQKLVDKDKN